MSIPWRERLNADVPQKKLKSLEEDYPWASVLKVMAWPARGVATKELMKLPQVKGVILAGPHGNGKHSLADALSGSVTVLKNGQREYLKLSPADIPTDISGSELCGLFRELIAYSRQAGWLTLVLDEPSAWDAWVQGAAYLARELENSDIFLIVIETDIGKIPTGLRRSLMLCPCVPPSSRQRENWINKNMSSPVALKLPNRSPKTLARLTDGFSWRQLQDLFCLIRVHHVCQAMSLTGGMQDMQKQVELLKSGGSVFLDKGLVDELIACVRAQAVSPAPVYAAVSQTAVLSNAESVTQSAGSAASAEQSSRSSEDTQAETKKMIDKHQNPDEMALDELLALPNYEL